ncbi:DUF7288 family protein [Halopiger goleimassiliensis]|uniref:DUF7288 family protein n=1 Tax=Halopiger goleimassiliensis TaxID=1293048 RepID=UPI00067781D6|nr:hypothetical protein [Halopiger goleimassiliensis]
MSGTLRSRTDRGQAYTLEGFIGAMVILMAVLFALQAVVITPTTGGQVDRTLQAQLQQEAQDALVVAGQDGDLSRTVRRWDATGTGFADIDPTDQESFAEHSTLGAILNQSFADEGRSYNVEVHYVSGSSTEATESTDLHRQAESPPSEAVVASHVVTLYDDQYVEPERNDRLDEVADANSLIPQANDGEIVYNVVEVRLIVW